MRHTPTPWQAIGACIFEENGSALIADCRQSDNPLVDTDDANAAFIVKACNMHEELVALLKEALDALNPQDGEITAMTIKQGWPWSQKVRALLTKAEGADS